MTEHINKIDEIYTSDAAVFATRYIEHLNDVLRGIDPKAIANFVDVLLSARERGAKIFFIGNGGSAATASHFANDLAIGTRARKKPFRAISLSDNNAVLTAIGNDFGYDEIFSRQLEYLAVPQDVVVAISASGNSPNIVKAIKFASNLGMTTIGLSGFDGGKLKELVKHKLHVPTKKGEYGPVEDAHMVLDHMVGAYLIKRLQAEG